MDTRRRGFRGMGESLKPSKCRNSLNAALTTCFTTCVAIPDVCCCTYSISLHHLGHGWIQETLNVEEIVKSFISCSVLSQLKHCQNMTAQLLG
ncbi:hypothetical protein VNO80_16722 [Phaseolus coccineus]|uniref:Uncharacterized protein n=1 Tax=Phaseolus coccineus TaxID=3886 RepID=A0AAN9MN01_PHACN